MPNAVRGGASPSRGFYRFLTVLRLSSQVRQQPPACCWQWRPRSARGPTSWARFCINPKDSAPKVRNVKAQGNALGTLADHMPEPQRGAIDAASAVAPL